MVRWPGDPPVRITRTAEVAAGDPSTVSHMSMGSHTGTHMDAPLHFIAGGKGLDQMPLSAVIGPARVVLIEHAHQITVQEIQRNRIRRGERILFKTRNSQRCWRTKTFVKRFVHLTPPSAQALATTGVQAVGVDYLSVGGYRLDDGPQVHRLLLRANIWIIEGLNLAAVDPGRYWLICLPLRVLHSDGAPARAVLRKQN